MQRSANDTFHRDRRVAPYDTPLSRSGLGALYAVAVCLGMNGAAFAEPASGAGSGNGAQTVGDATIPELLGQLRNSSAARRREALLRLADKDVDTETILTNVWPLLDDSDLFVRAHAARTIWLVGNRADLAVKALGELVDPKHPQVCALATFLLGEIGPAARPALPPLRARMTESDPLLRLHAAEAVAKIDPADSAAHTILIRGLRDQSPDARYFAACALLTAGSKYREQVRSALLDALSDDDLRVASAAALSLEGWESRVSGKNSADLASSPTEITSLLNRQVSNLSDASPTVRRQAAVRLADSDATAGQQVVQALKNRLEDEDPVVRAYFAYALWEVDHKASAVLPTLIDLLGTIRPNVTTLATSVLAQIGPDASDALPSLYDLMETSDQHVRLHVAIAISRIDPRGRDAIGILTTAAHDEDSDTRYLATLALGHVSLPFRKRAERELNAALQDRNFRVRAAAELALDQLDLIQARARNEARVAAATAAEIRSAPAPSLSETSPVVSAVVEDELANMTEMIPVIDEVAVAKAEPEDDPEIKDKDYDLDEVTVEEKKTIGQLRARITPSDGDLPVDHAAPHFAGEPHYRHVTGTVRGWYGLSFAWEPPGVCHQPLYFQDLNLERYGYHYGCWQWLVSSAKFATDAALLPYQVVCYHPCDCIYTLGYDRPGNCVPYRCYRLPWRTDAASVLGGVAVGLFFLAPP